MKKSILSIFILSTTFLSAQSNAVEYVENGIGVVDINGLVTAVPKCTLQATAPIQLLNVQASDFADTNLANVEAQPLNINFENCTNDLINIKLRVKNQGKSILENTIATKDNGSNVSVAILDATRAEIDLSKENIEQFKGNINKETNTASYTFFANYKKPNDTDATPGQVKTSLNFDVIYSDVADQS